MNHKPRISMFHTDFIYITERERGRQAHIQYNYHDDVMQQVMKYGNFIEASSLQGSSAHREQHHIYMRTKKKIRLVEYIKTLAT